MNNSDYDNVFLVPNGISNIQHRGDVDLRTKFYGLYPIMSSPMKGISGSSLVLEMGRNNCLGILHRFASAEERIRMIDEVSKPEDGRGGVPFGIAIGINDFEKEAEIANYAVENGAILICVDIANGYLPQLEEIGRELRSMYDVMFMCGNVVTKSGSDYLSDCGFEFARIGIGSGSLCTTRNKTSVGRNQLAALRECSYSDIVSVSDGGINEPGKAVKSFAFGADWVMLGGILADSFESEHNGVIFGMASHRNHVLNNKEVKSVEGKDLIAEKRLHLKDILDDYLWGIRSACTYLNCSHYSELQNRDKVRIVPVNEW